MADISPEMASWGLSDDEAEVEVKVILPSPTPQPHVDIKSSSAPRRAGSTSPSLPSLPMVSQFSSVEIEPSGSWERAPSSCIMQFSQPLRQQGTTSPHNFDAGTLTWMKNAANHPPEPNSAPVEGNGGTWGRKQIGEPRVAQRRPGTAPSTRNGPGLRRGADSDSCGGVGAGGAGTSSGSSSGSAVRGGTKKKKGATKSPKKVVRPIDRNEVPGKSSRAEVRGTAAAKRGRGCELPRFMRTTAAAVRAAREAASASPSPARAPGSPSPPPRGATLGPGLDVDLVEDLVEAQREDLWPRPPVHWRPGPGDAARLRLTPEREGRLRGLVVELAAGFAGTPYFHIDDSFAQAHATAEARAFYAANPGSPAFLDCCGLVRAVFWELHRRQEIAFKIKRFNQNYQRRALPGRASRISSLAKVRPGDLVFYLAKPREGAVGIKSTQPVKHVEILLGDGTPGTIGSRWGGVVQRHADFKYESGRWEVIAHEFHSIDSWLEYGAS